MNSIYKSTSRVENFFSMLLTKAKISNNLFIGNMPATVDSSWKEMILVDVVSIRDYGGYCDASVNIFLYAKSEDSHGTKPVKTLYPMEVALNKAIEQSKDEHYVVDVNFNTSDYDQNRNYYYNVTNVKVTIK